MSPAAAAVATGVPLAGQVDADAARRPSCLTPEEIAFLREDAELRRRAPLAYPATSDVVTKTQGHPVLRTFCENCHAVGSTLSWCGVRLCIPCWRKQGGRSAVEIARTLSTIVKRRRSSGMRPGLRFVTLTERSAPTLVGAERLMRGAFDRMTRSGAWRFWSECSVDKSEVTWNPETGLWHFHLHLVVLGRFIPHDHRQARHDPGCRRPVDGRCLPTCEPNLKDEWESATEGRGSVVDVREVATTSPVAFAVEMAKYIAKPFAETAGGAQLPLEEWPQEVLLELAQWLGGGTRTVWRCGTHASMNRRVCSSLETDRWPCEGRYRKEWVGARRLRWRGELRRVHRELAQDELAARETDDLEAACASCGKGPVISAYEVRRRLLLGWVPPDGIDPSLFDPPPRRLPSIQAHKSARHMSAGASRRASRSIKSARCRLPTEGTGPPLGVEC